MPNIAEPIYRRGKYWLDWDRKRDGSLRSPFLTAWWYDPAARRIRSRSTGTPESERAVMFLDRLYLADNEQAPAFCPTCGRGMASAKSYLIADALADYRLEVGDERASADSIAARLSNALDFLDATKQQAATCDLVDEAFVRTYRKWLAAKPVEWRNKAGAVTRSKVRSAAAVEEAVNQLFAALHHAKAQKRIEAVPVVKHLTRAQVSRPRTHRGSVEQLAAILTYAADTAHPRRRPLHAFVVGTLFTLARPSSVFGISTAPERDQWRGDVLLLNPADRVQTDKRRPILPCPPALKAWLTEVAADPKAKGWLCEVAGEPVVSVKTAWNTMLAELGLPMHREWKPYVLRHTLASLLRDRGATEWDLKGQLGHRVTSTTEIYAVSELYVTAQAALSTLIAELRAVAPHALHRRRTGAGSSVAPLGSTK